MSPELKNNLYLVKNNGLNKIKYNPFKSDVYSFAITLLYLIGFTDIEIEKI